MHFTVLYIFVCTFVVLLLADHHCGRGPSAAFLRVRYYHHYPDHLFMAQNQEEQVKDTPSLALKSTTYME